jgi:hypothetical protein
VRPSTTFFTVGDERFFPGVVCLLNSLRLSGNDVRLVILDLGLTDQQRRRLSPHVQLVDAPPEVREQPVLLKPFAHLLDPQGTVVMIDSDMIVTRPLDPVLELADAGSVCLFGDPDDRWFAEWEEAFGLSAPPRRQGYLNAGFIALSTHHWPKLLGRFWEACRRIPDDALRGAGGAYEQPFWNADQDAINALLMSEVSADAVVELPPVESPSPDELDDVTIVDERTLACEHRGHRPYLLHYWGGPKPWQPQAWMRATDNAYVRLMPRVLFAPDVPVRMRPAELPIWLRPGLAGRASLAVLSAVNRGARVVLARIPPGARRRLARAIRTIGR